MLIIKKIYYNHRYHVNYKVKATTRFLSTFFRVGESGIQHDESRYCYVENVEYELLY